MRKIDISARIHFTIILAICKQVIWKKSRFFAFSLGAICLLPLHVGLQRHQGHIAVTDALNQRSSVLQGEVEGVAVTAAGPADRDDLAVAGEISLALVLQIRQPVWNMGHPVTPLSYFQYIV